MVNTLYGADFFWETYFDGVWKLLPAELQQAAGSGV